MLDGSADSQIVILIASAFAMILPFTFLIAWILKGPKIIANAANSIKNGLQGAAQSLGKASKKGAMNTSYGQAAQQFMGNRKSIAALQGRETLRGLMKSNPGLAKALMGGVGGGKQAARFLDAESRKQDAETVANLKQGLTANVAGAIGGKEDLRRAVSSGTWSSGRTVTASDMAAIQKLQQEGYMSADYTPAKSSPQLAKAALGSIMDAEIASPQNISGLAEHLKGAGQQENALFTEMLQAEAGKHGYKNLQYADVTDGNFNQYYVKDQKSILNSGISGINKDALDPDYDMSMLNEIKNQYTAAKAAGPKQEAMFVRKIAEQTKHIDKESIVKAIAAQVGYGTSTTKADGTGSVSVDPDAVTEFVNLRAALKSQGAMQLPERFRDTDGGGPTPPTSPPSGTPPPPPGWTESGGGLVIPRER